jgi:hypothetical protein
MTGDGQTPPKAVAGFVAVLRSASGKSGYGGSYVWVPGTTIGFQVVERRRGAEPPSSLDGTMIRMLTDLGRSSR